MRVHPAERKLGQWISSRMSSLREKVEGYDSGQVFWLVLLFRPSHPALTLAVVSTIQIEFAVKVSAGQ